MQGDYLRELFKLYGDETDAPAEPQLPDWCFEEEEEDDDLGGGGGGGSGNGAHNNASGEDGGRGGSRNRRSDERTISPIMYPIEASTFRTPIDLTQLIGICDHLPGIFRS